MTKVSVIIPTYNRAKLIGRAIQSVLNQSYRDFEIIVVDDGSTDNTEEVVKSFNDERIKYIRHRKNRGGSAARNTGIKVAKGEYIGFLDDDDEWLPEKLEKHVEKFQVSSKNVGVIYCGSNIVLESSRVSVKKFVPVLRGNLFLNFLENNCIIMGGSTFIVRKECFKRVGLFDEALPTQQDWEMLIRISRYYEFDIIPDALVKYYIHTNTHGARFINVDAAIQGKETLMRKYGNDLTKHPKILARHFNALGKLYSIKGDRKKGLKYFWKAIKLDPTWIKYYAHFFLLLVAPQVHRKIVSRRIIPIDNIGKEEM